MTNAARVLDALGDPTRRQIFELIAKQPLSVAQVADQVPVSRPAVSQHLKVLKEVQLVKDEPDGTRRVYSLNRDGINALYRYLDQFWDDALSRFKGVAERAAKNQPPHAKKEK